MHDVEAAAAEPEVRGLDVDDHLVALLRAGRSGPDRRSPAAASPSSSSTVQRAITRSPASSTETTRASPQLQHSAPPRAEQPQRHVEHLLQRRRAHALVRRVVRLGAVGDVQAAEALAPANAFASLPPPVDRVAPARRRSRAAPPRPTSHDRIGRRGSGRRGTAPRPSRRRRSRSRLRPRCSASTISRMPALAFASSRLRTSASTRQRSATTLVAVPPSITPTLAVVSVVDAAELHRADRLAPPPRSRCGPPPAAGRRAPRGRGSRRSRGSRSAPRRSARRSAMRGRTRSRSRPRGGACRTPWRRAGRSPRRS